MCATLGLTVALSNHTARGMLRAAVANATGMLDARSPGARPAGALTQTKARLVANPALRHGPGSAPVLTPGAPQSRVLGDTRSDSAIPFETVQSPDAVQESVSSPAAVAGAAPVETAIPSPATAPIAAVPVPTATTPAAATTPPVTAVPEPETYVMLTLGIGLIGWAFRRRQAKGASTPDGEATQPATE